MENKDYSFVANKLSNEGAIKINSGEYEGLIYSYGKVGFKEQEGKDELVVAFDYTIHKYPDVLPDGWENGKFIDFLGDILMEVMDKEIKAGTLNSFLGDETKEIKETDETFNVNFEYKENENVD